jgi:hypothetical protein
MLRDYRHDIGPTKTEGGKIDIVFVGFSIQMAVEDVDCFHLSEWK